ncbi:hypothetical protein SGUI_1777 [Serinicoccus hydrothermalis]|uniref:Uncharacterized protein n=1 Tax=Serinicoccus hydrothermalis TaxID=1758689 RepID=A0A1B1NCL9_9MICO|nr:hypothetical protein SGUI_1777 [Serinicoccus hydrothermalis]
MQSGRAVLIVSCTSLAEQVSIVSSEFQELVQGIRVDAGPVAG